jgi:hypothetical protein
MEKMFTKQHFEKIAKLAINSPAQTKQDFIKEMAEMFKADNQKFNTEKFFAKSGLNNRVSGSNYLKVILFTANNILNGTLKLQF